MSDNSIYYLIFLVSTLKHSWIKICVSSKMDIMNGLIICANKLKSLMSLDAINYQKRLQLAQLNVLEEK